jgi:hypothetical protein
VVVSTTKYGWSRQNLYVIHDYIEKNNVTIEKCAHIGQSARMSNFDSENEAQHLKDSLDSPSPSISLISLADDATTMMRLASMPLRCRLLMPVRQYWTLPYHILKVCSQRRHAQFPFGVFFGSFSFDILHRDVRV